jgi:hypothetical protein
MQQQPVLALARRQPPANPQTHWDIGCCSPDRPVRGSQRSLRFSINAGRRTIRYSGQRSEKLAINSSRNSSKLRSVNGPRVVRSLATVTFSRRAREGLLTSIHSSPTCRQRRSPSSPGSRFRYMRQTQKPRNGGQGGHSVDCDGGRAPHRPWDSCLVCPYAWTLLAPKSDRRSQVGGLEFHADWPAVWWGSGPVAIFDPCEPRRTRRRLPGRGDPYRLRLRPH